MTNPRFPLPAPDRRVEIPARRFRANDDGHDVARRCRHERLEALSLFAGLAVAALSMADGVAPVASAVSGFAASCVTGLIAMALMKIFVPVAIQHHDAAEPLS